jgi:peptide deformylase
MSILKIARMGHPVLRTPARALDRPALRSAAVQKLIDDMIETMTEYRGVGLAAPQVTRTCGSSSRCSTRTTTATMIARRSWP